MTNKDLIALGFEPMPHFTVGDAVTFDLGRRRYLSASCVGTANEMLFICEKDKDFPNIVDGAICLYNFDYDGLLTVEKVSSLIKSLGVGCKKCMNADVSNIGGTYTCPRCGRRVK